MKVHVLLALLAVSGSTLAQLPSIFGTTTTTTTSVAPPTSSVPSSTTTTAPSSSVPPSSSSTSDTSSVPSTTTAPTTSSVPPTSSSVTSAPPKSTSSSSSIQPSTSVTFVSSETTLSPTATSTPSPPSSDNSNKTGIIAGATVGGLVGLALIGGIFTWINRKGGCTRRRQRDSDFDDYGMDDNDFAPRPMQSASVAAAAAGAGALATGPRQEPTLPHFGGDQYYDDQYANNGARRFVPSYQPQLQQHPDYYNGQQQGQYYNYPGSDQGYSDTTYNDPNYYGGAAAGGYYDSKTAGSGDAYKPDDAVENKPHEKL